MSSSELQPMTVINFGKQTQPNQIINDEISDTNPNSVATEDSENVLCIIFKGGKIGSAYYSCQDKMVSKCL